MVEQMLNPSSVMMACIEEIINKAINQIISEKKEYHFIGQPYALDMKDYDSENPSLSFSLDVYPVLVEKDTKWKKVKVTPYTTELTEEEITGTLDQLRSSYADFQDVAEVAEDVLTRIKITYLNGKEVV